MKTFNFKSIGLSLVLSMTSLLPSGAFAEEGIDLFEEAAPAKAEKYVTVDYQDPSSGETRKAMPIEILAAYDQNGNALAPGEVVPASRISARRLRTDDADDNGERNGSGVAGLLSIELSYPQVVAARVGMIIGSADTPELVRGVLLQFEIGFSGIGGSIGYGEKGDMVGGVSGMQLKASVLYTQDYVKMSGDKMFFGLQPNQLYVGPEAQISFGALQLSIGALYKLAGDNPDAAQWILKAGIGVGI